VASIVNNYTVLPLQVAGVLVAGVVLVMLARIPRALAVPMAAAALLTVIAVNQLWSGAGAFDAVRKDLTGIGPGAGEREKCLFAGGNTDMIGFGRWLSQRMPSDATFRYVSTGFDRPCFQFAMLPRRMVSGPARFTVYADPKDPESIARLADQRKLPQSDREIEFYSPNFAIERTG